MSIETYLLNYKQFKFVLNEARQKQQGDKNGNRDFSLYFCFISNANLNYLQ